jgi:hypothetical protein
MKRGIKVTKIVIIEGERYRVRENALKRGRRKQLEKEGR